MFSLLRKLFSIRDDGMHTVIITDNDNDDSGSSYSISAAYLWAASAGVFILLFGIIIVLLKFTPLSGLLFNQKKVRSSAITMQQEVAALSDTVKAQNMQLSNIKAILIAAEDSSPGAEQHSIHARLKAMTAGHHHEAEQLPANTVLVANLFNKTGGFSSSYPVKGIITQGFNINNGHLGLDIATDDGAAFKAITNGVIISQEWTFNYGYVIIIQHAQGVITVYKHAKTVQKDIGQTVQQGDILGTIGDVGMLSSGPHLHIEIWKNGIPQDPRNYLMD